MRKILEDVSMLVGTAFVIAGFISLAGGNIRLWGLMNTFAVGSWVAAYCLKEEKEVK